MISDQSCRLFLNIKALTFFDKKTVIYVKSQFYLN